MALDPNIALGVKGIEVPNPVAQYAQVAQLQNLQTQNQVSQMQLDQMRRDEATLQQIQAKAVEHGGPADLNQIADAYLKSGNPKFVEFGVGLRQKLDERKQFGEIMGLGGPSAAAPAPSAAAAPNALASTMQPGALGSGTFGITPAPVNQLAPAPAAPAPAPAANALATPDVSLMRRKRDALLAMGTTQSIAAARAMDADIALASRDLTPSDIKTMSALGYPITQAGFQQFREAQRQERLLTPDEEKQKIRIALASRPLRPEPTPAAPVKVVDESGKVKYVSREEAISKGMTPADAMEGITPKEIQTREAKYPAATSAVKTFESSADKLATDLEKLANHPGLSGISGLIYGRTPAVTKDARAAQALYDSIVARGGFQELANMRAASPTGGALGNVSNQEGQYLRDAFAPISRTQDTTDLSRSLREAANATRSSKQRLREAYDMTYEYKNQGKGVSAPAGGAIPPPAGFKPD